MVTQPEDVGVSSSRLTRLSRWMRDLVTGGKLAGISVMISRRGHTIWQSHSGMADIGHRRPMSADTIVRLYSMSKPITSVAAMILVETGQVQLDDPISLYLPQFRNSRVYAGVSRGKW